MTTFYVMIDASAEDKSGETNAELFRRAANELMEQVAGITGWLRNTPDEARGDVAPEFEGVAQCLKITIEDYSDESEVANG